MVFAQGDFIWSEKVEVKTKQTQVTATGLKPTTT